MLKGSNKMLKTMGAVWVVLAVGCVAPELPELDETETGEVEQHLEPCPGCGVNSLRQSEWNYVFHTLDGNALDNFGLWDGVAVSPVSLCKPGTVSDDKPTCKVRQGWLDWLAADTYVQRRGGIFRNLVKVALEGNQTILPPDGTVFPDGSPSYQGMFGLMPYARGSSWGPAGREIASAGLLALLNSVSGVPLCLNTRDKPGHCAGSSATYSESITFGDATHGSRYIAIYGGKDAPFPLRNPRYGSVSPESAAVHNNATNVCDTVGEHSARYPVRCRYDGHTWNNPVHVLIPSDPKDSYYDTDNPVPPIKPAGWPTF